MYNIIISKDNLEGISSDDFLSKIQKIANQHRRENRAKAFAFIIADQRNAQMQKILTDENYWHALHIISGSNLTVFYLTFSKEKIEKEKTIEMKMPRSAPGTISMLTPLRVEKYESNYFLDVLAKDDEYSQVSLPGILFFQTDGKNIIGRKYIKLSDDANVEELFSLLKNYIKNVSETLSHIKPQYILNYEAIFREVLATLEERQFKVFLKKIPLAPLIGSIRRILT